MRVRIAGALALAALLPLIMTACAATVTPLQWFLMHRAEIWRLEEDQVAAQGTVNEIMADAGASVSAYLIRAGAAFESGCSAVERDVSAARADWSVPTTSSGSDTPQKDLFRVEEDGAAYFRQCRSYLNGDTTLMVLNHVVGSYDDAVTAWLRSLA